MPKFPPLPDRTWRVSVRQSGKQVEVEPNNCSSGTHGGGFFFPSAAYVSPPNFIERLFGVTFESKVERMKRKCQQWCDRRNVKEGLAKDALNQSENVTPVFSGEPYVWLGD